MPERIQRQRTAGWRKPEGTVIVDRSTRWGNPFRTGEPYRFHCPTCGPRIGVTGGNESAVLLFDHFLAARADLRDAIRRELAGKDLACWCPLDQPCHADVLLRIANPPAEDGSR